jgi:hypothetical protein
MVNKLVKGRLMPSGMLLSLATVNFIIITAENLKSDKEAKCVYCTGRMGTVHF